MAATNYSADRPQLNEGLFESKQYIVSVNIAAFSFSDLPSAKNSSFHFANILASSKYKFESPLIQKHYVNRLNW